MHAEDHDSNHLVYTRKTVNTQRLRLHSQSFIPNGYHARESAAPKCVLFTPPVGPQWVVRLPFFRRVRSTLSPFCLPKHQIASWSWSLFDGVSLELRWNPQAALRILECEVPCPLPLHSRVSFIAARPSGHMDCLHSTKLRTTQDCDPSCSKVDQHFDAISWPENGVISKYTSLFLITCGTTRLVEFTLQIGKLGSFRNALTRSSCNCKKGAIRIAAIRTAASDLAMLECCRNPHRTFPSQSPQNAAQNDGACGLEVSAINDSSRKKLPLFLPHVMCASHLAVSHRTSRRVRSRLANFVQQSQPQRIVVVVLNDNWMETQVKNALHCALDFLRNFDQITEHSLRPRQLEVSKVTAFHLWHLPSRTHDENPAPLERQWQDHRATDCQCLDANAWNTISLATRLIQLSSFMIVLIALIAVLWDRKPSSSDTFTSLTSGDRPSSHGERRSLHGWHMRPHEVAREGPLLRSPRHERSSTLEEKRLTPK